MAYPTDNERFLRIAKVHFRYLKGKSFYGKFLDPHNNSFKLALCKILWNPRWEDVTIIVANSLQSEFKITAEPYVELLVLDEPFVEGPIGSRNYTDRDFTKYYMHLSKFILDNYNKEMVGVRMSPLP